MITSFRFGIACLLASGWAWGRALRLEETTGSSQSLEQPGASSLNVKTIAPGLFEEQGSGPGKIANGVNLFTGQPGFSIPLGGLSARGVTYAIGLGYSGATKVTMDNDNERAPASWVGLGFDLSTPFVAVNHKGTYASFDDLIFCNLGPYGGGQILMDSARTRYYVSTNPYIKIAFDTASSGELAGQFTAWTFTFPDGKKMRFGQDPNAQRYVLYNKSSIKASPYTYVAAQRFIYRWDLRSFYDTIPGKPPRNILTFEYDTIQVQASSGKSYIGESYPKNIKWMEGSTEIERYEFKTAAKSASEYVGYTSDEMRDDQKLFETRRLDTLKCYKQGVLTHFYKFDMSKRRKNGMDSVSVLDSIRVFYPKPSLSPGAFVRDSGWTFTYDPSRFNILSSVTYPSSRKDTYTYSPFAFSDGPAAMQDYTDYTLYRADGTTPISLPTDTAKLSKWKVEANCDERFCFSVIRDGDGDSLPGEFGITQKAYVEVKRNSGNYFDPRTTDNGDLVTVRLELGDASTLADEWKVVPSGNYFLAYSEHTGLVKLYEYDGIRWEDKTSAAFGGDPLWTGSTFGGTIKVFASNNYFLIQTMDLPSKVIVALKKATGWTTLNRSSSNCEFSNEGYYGETIRGPSGSCLQWDRNNLILTPNSNFFTILDSLTGVFTAYALKKNGLTFEEITSKFQVVTAGSIQKTNYPMDWEKSVVSVTSGGDYFIVVSQNTSGPSACGFYFNGDSLINIFYHGRIGSGYMQMFPSSDYLIEADAYNGKRITFYKRSVSDGAPSFGSATDIRTDCDSTYRLLIRTHPYAFSIEYYADSAGFGLRPKLNSGGNYQSYFFQVNGAFQSGFRERSSQLSGNGPSLFNVSFSPSDNMLVATFGYNGTGLCNENIQLGSCTQTFYTARFHPRDTTTFIDTPHDRISISTNTSWQPLKQAHQVMSNAARMGMQITLDTTGSQKRARYRVFQYDGKAFSFPDSEFVVSSVTSSAGLTDEDRHRVTYNFLYAPYGSSGFPIGQARFNSHTLSPQLEFADIQQVNSVPGANLGTTRTFFNLDCASNPLMGKSMFLIGSEKYSLNMSSTIDTTLTMTTLSEPYHNPAWPKTLYVNHPKVTYTRTMAKNQSHMSDTTYYFNFCDTNGAPRFTLRNNRPDKILLSQGIYDSLGFPKQSIAYRLVGQPDTTNLKTCCANAPYRSDSAIASSKSVFQGYFFQEDSLWRDADPSLTDADLRSGKTPAFSLSRNWLPAHKVTLRDTNNYFQILESKAVKSGLSNALGESYTSFFYEGLRSDPVATVQNAKLANCAVLMAENGNAVLPNSNYLDYQQKWLNFSCAFSPNLSHTGAYSIKVTDHIGPTVNLYLKDVRTQGFGFKVSAWVYSDTGTPMMVVERHQSNGTLVDALQGAPVSGSIVAKTWQRWEANLSNAQLISNNLFNGNSDYLRILVGTGAPIGQPARIIYVDDIVCAPTQTTFALTTYDRLGPPSSSTDSHFITTFYDIGFKGNVTAVRDDRYRMFSQAAMHKMGEN